jgi:hypothetical protein
VRHTVAVRNREISVSSETPGIAAQNIIKARKDLSQNNGSAILRSIRNPIETQKCLPYASPHLIAR